MSIARSTDVSTPARSSTRASGSTTLVVAQLIAGLLLVSVGIWLGLLFQAGFNGGGILVAFGAVEVALGAMALAALPGLRAGRRPGWVRPLSIVGAVFNAAIIVFAAVATLSVSYPGGAVVLLILCNDVIIGELVVSYFITRPAD